MSADTLVSRLEGVRQTGQGRWTARCPAHDDRHPSLSIRELDDGRVLVRDFAGCTVEEILHAVGLGWDAVMPERVDTLDREGAQDGQRRYRSGERRPFLPTDVFEIARTEIGVAAIIACDMHKMRSVSDADSERLLLAAERLAQIAEAAYGK